jgi:hypothetical protein
MWDGHSADSNHEVVPCGPRIYTLKLYKRLLSALFYLLFSKIYAKGAIRRFDGLADLRSQRHARIVNRNEPFGSILEAANSHFWKLLTFFVSAAGRIRCHSGRQWPPKKWGFSPAITNLHVSPAVSRRMDTMSLSCRQSAVRHD